jgi:hypothetical protein
MINVTFVKPVSESALGEISRLPITNPRGIKIANYALAVYSGVPKKRFSTKRIPSQWNGPIILK